MSDTDALAVDRTALAETIAARLHKMTHPCHHADDEDYQDCRYAGFMSADAILASDWLAAHDAQVRADARREVAAERWLTGRELIAAERHRQVETEGWTEEHDREHGPELLAKAGHAYWRNDPSYWPWHGDWWKPKSEFRNFVRAGALYTAAMEIADDDADPGRAHYTSLVQYVADDLDARLAEVRNAVTDERECDACLRGDHHACTHHPACACYTSASGQHGPNGGGQA